MNNIQIDKLTELCFKLYIEGNNYEDKRLKHYNYLLKNMETIEKNTGILTKDFIKKLINREKELENEIFELKEKVKSLEIIKNTSNNTDVPLGYNIFLNMIKCARVNYNYGDINDFGIYDGTPTISIDDYRLMPNELEYINKIIKNDRKPYIGTEKNISTTSPKLVDTYEKILACDRAWNMLKY